jgi:hypothetical protein
MDCNYSFSGVYRQLNSVSNDVFVKIFYVSNNDKTLKESLAFACCRKIAGTPVSSYSNQLDRELMVRVDLSSD